MNRITFSAALILVVVVSQSRADWNSTIALSNPLNWYRLDEVSGPTAFDYGSQGLHGIYGTGNHAPTRGVPGLVGTAVDFDGNQRNIIFGGSDLTGDWSAEFVLKKTGEKFSAELLRGVPLAFPSTHLKLEQYPNTHQVGYTQSFVADLVFSPPVIAPVGQFIALVYVKSATEMKLYVNGILRGTTDSPISLSRYQFGDTESESPIALVDEIVVYDRALSPAEVASHFASIPEPASITLFSTVFFVALARRHRKFPYGFLMAPATLNIHARGQAARNKRYAACQGSARRAVDRRHSS